MNDDHRFGEELQDLLDGRLAEPARAEIAAHVARCPRCREELAVLERARAAARGLPPLAQPADLAVQIARALDAEDRASAPGRTRPRLPHRWPFVAAGLIAAAVLVALLLLPSATVDLPAAVARDFAGYRDARLALELRTGDPTALERFFAERGIAFPTRVFDLAMMQYRLAGGRVPSRGWAPERVVRVHRARCCSAHLRDVRWTPRPASTRRSTARPRRHHLPHLPRGRDYPRLLARGRRSLRARVPEEHRRGRAAGIREGREDLT